MSNKRYKNDFHKLADLNNDRNITEQELAHYEKLVELENEDNKASAQRKMAWFSLFGMIFYPFVVVIADVIGLQNTPTVLADIAPTYFVSVAAIVAAFYGKEAYVSKKGK